MKKRIKILRQIGRPSLYFLSLLSRFEFLGKLALPLLKMENGRKRWHALKDKKMRLRAKGSNATANPQGPYSVEKNPL